MKPIIKILILMLILPNISLALEPARELTEEELMPFCNNKMIWSNFNVTPSQCLDASKSCTSELAKQSLDFMEAAEKFNPCVFKKLGINIPN